MEGGGRYWFGWFLGFVGYGYGLLGYVVLSYSFGGYFWVFLGIEVLRLVFFERFGRWE